MAIEIKEEVGISYKVLPNLKESLKEKQESCCYGISENSLMVKMESIHSVLTKNLNYYEPHCLESSVPKWTSPYEKPVIMHHNESNGTIIGRIKKVEYMEKSKRSNTPCLLFTCNIGDKEGIEGVKNGTLATTSIGVIVYDLRCSICGQNLAEEGECEHVKGQKYDDKLCFWIIKEMEPKEVSYVIVPSDKFAHNIDIYEPDLKKLNALTESSKDNEVNKLTIKDLYHDELSKQIIDNQLKELSEAQEDDTKPETKDKVEDKSKDEVKDEVKNEVKNEAKDKELEQKEKVKDDKENIEVKDKVEDKVENEVKDKVEDKSKDEIDDKTDDLKNEAKELKKKVEELLDKITTLNTKLKTEQGLRESAEIKLLDIKRKQKIVLAEQVNELRKKLELEEEDVNTLIESSEEVLNDKIETLKEFTTNINKIVKKMPKLNSSSLVEQEQDNTCVHDKKIDHQIDTEKLMIEKYKKLINRD